MGNKESCVQSLLDEVAREFPAWYFWQGIGGLLYARRLMSSPPVVLRDITPEGLRSQIRSWKGWN